MFLVMALITTAAVTTTVGLVVRVVRIEQRSNAALAQAFWARLSAQEAHARTEFPELHALLAKRARIHSHPAAAARPVRGRR